MEPSIYKPSIYNGNGVYNNGGGGGGVQEMTLRFMFSDSSYNPQAAGVGSSGTWKKKLDTNYNVWDWTNNNVSWHSAFLDAFNDAGNTVEIIDAGNTSALTILSRCFEGCSSLKSTCLFDTSAVTYFYRAFRNCSGLLSVPFFDLSNVLESGASFLGCSSLKSVPNFNLSKVNSGVKAQQMFDGCSMLEDVPDLSIDICDNVSYMFRNCSSLKKVPSLNIPNVVNTSGVFQNCRKVESGALDMYNYLSTKDIVVTSYSNTFLNCGIDTVTGAAELAQIPSSWGGTGA